MRKLIGRSRLTAAMAALGVAAVVAGCGTAAEQAGNGSAAATTTATETVAWSPKEGLPLRDPREVRSRNGVLEVDLVARKGQIVVSGSPVTAQPFNGQLIGPTLRVKPGDTIRATIHNGTDAQTNIHYHGLHVSPRGVSDNVFRTFEPGRTVKSVVRLPKDHEPGTFWYHAHFHGLSEGQLMGGLSGLIVVDGLKDLLPRDLRRVKERKLALRNLQLVREDEVATLNKDVSAFKDSARLINGLLRPTFGIRSGETQMWSFANVGSDLYYDISVGGHAMAVIAEDGAPVWKVSKFKRLVLPPGKRFDVLVQGGKPGRYAIKAHRYEGFAPLPDVDLGYVTVTGRNAKPKLSIPKTLPTRTVRLGKAKIAKRRTFTFDFGTGSGFTAEINGEVFDPKRTALGVRLGTVEEWTLVNPTEDDHPFHIHVNDFQVMSVNGKPYKARGLQDVVTIPRGGRVVIRNTFDDFTGHFVFHCHILGHEDAGMMQAIQVLRKGEKATPPPQAGMHHDHDH